MKSKTIELLALLVILLFAVWVRFLGSDVLLPQRQAPDTYMVDQALLLQRGILDSRPIMESKYPHLMAQMLRVLLPDDSEKAPFLGISNESVLQAYLNHASSPYLYARILVILVSLLLIPGAWLLARRFLGPWSALFATALIATSLLHAVYSKQARPHAPEAAFILLALLSYFQLMGNSRIWNLALSGVFTSLAICCLQNGFFCLPALFVAVLFRHKSNPKKCIWELGVLTLMIGGIVLCFYSFHLSGNFKISGLQRGILNFQDICFKDLFVHFFFYDPILAALTIIGSLFFIFKIKALFPLDRNRELVVLLAFALPYLLIVGLYGENQIRYLLPLLPMFAVLGAMGVEKIMCWNKTARIVICLLLLSLPAFAAGKLAILHSNPDTLTMAARWFEENADHKKTHILKGEGIQVPLLYTKPSFAEIWSSPWSRYQRKIKQRIPGLPKWKVYPLVARKIAYNRVELNTDLLQKILRDNKKKYIVMKLGSPTAKKMLKSRKSIRLKPVARFDIYDGAEDSGHHYFHGYQDTHMLSRVLKGKFWGPPIEIYEMSLDRNVIR